MSTIRLLWLAVSAANACMCCPEAGLSEGKEAEYVDSIPIVAIPVSAKPRTAGAPGLDAFAPDGSAMSPAKRAIGMLSTYSKQKS